MNGLDVLVGLVDRPGLMALFAVACAIATMFAIVRGLKRIFWGEISLQELGDEERPERTESKPDPTNNTTPMETDAKISTDGKHRSV